MNPIRARSGGAPGAKGRSRAGSRERMLGLALAAALSLAQPAQTRSPAPADARAFHQRVAALYSFAPHRLNARQIERKSKALDGFWAEVKANPARYLPLLRRELGDGSGPSFFAYDGSKLLLSVSQDRKDETLALQAIPRVDLRDVQQTDYLVTVHWLATRGLDTTKAALRILDYPQFKAFIVQHALTLGQDYSLIYMLFPMPDSNFVGPLIARLDKEKEPVSQMSILLALWYSMTPEGKAAVARFGADAGKPAKARAYARRLSGREAPMTSMFTLSSVAELKKERRKVMYRISDEALDEFDALTAKLLAKQ